METKSPSSGNKFNLTSAVVLNNGLHMPWFGLGVWQADDKSEVEKAIRVAVATGYRLIDTAAIYNNEEGCGRGIANSGVARQDIFVTSKLWNEDIRLGKEQAAFAASLKKLNLSHLDLYLVHWPIAGKLESGWKAMEKIYESEKAKAVGVSNFHVAHLRQIAKSSKLLPAVNQIECHPFLQQREVRDYCKDYGIAVQAWSPLMQGNFKGIPVLDKICKKHNRTEPQILLRWNLQNNILTIPKSVHETRIVENSKIFDFALDDQDLAELASLDCGTRFGPNPDNFQF